MPPRDEIKHNFPFSARLMTDLSIGGLVLSTFRRAFKNKSYVGMD